MANGQAPDMSALIGTLLANPDALSSIMGILKNSGITLNKPEATDFVQKDEVTEAKTAEADAVRIHDEQRDEHPDIDEIPSRNEKASEKKDNPRKKPGREERERLLSALRPYLSKSRYDTLDEIIKFASILELFRKKGGKK